MERMKPEKITKTLEKIGNAHSIKELDTEEFKEQMGQLADTTFQYNQNRVPEPEKSKIGAAFLSGDPCRALKRLVDLRRGSEGVGRFASGIRKGFELENPESTIVWVYRWLLKAFGNVMRSDDVCREYIESGGLESSLGELNSLEVQQQRDSDPLRSPTAEAICAHLSLIYSTSCWPSVKDALRAELRRCGFFPILMHFAQSTYVLHPTALFPHFFIIYSVVEIH